MCGPAGPIMIGPAASRVRDADHFKGQIVPFGTI
jgi:hypothetical protein